MWRLASLILASILIFLSVILYRVGIAEYQFGKTELSYGSVINSIKSARELDVPALQQLISKLNDLQDTPLYPSRYLEYLGSLHSLIADKSVWRSEKEASSKISTQFYAAAIEKRGPADSYLRLKLMAALRAQAESAALIQDHVVLAMRYRPNVHSLMPLFLWYCLEYIHFDTVEFTAECRSTFKRFESTGRPHELFARQYAEHANYSLLAD
jgi:hypothetical protein